MISISKMTDYATLLMSHFALAPEDIFSASHLAELTALPLPTVSKLLKNLVVQHLLVSTRGVHGGYRLARSAADISVGQIIAALDGPLQLTVCSQGENHCQVQSRCGLQTNWRVINQAIILALDQVSLLDMAQTALPTKQLEASLLQSMDPLMEQDKS